MISSKINSGLSNNSPPAANLLIDEEKNELNDIANSFGVTVEKLSEKIDEHKKSLKEILSKLKILEKSTTILKKPFNFFEKS